MITVEMIEHIFYGSLFLISISYMIYKDYWTQKLFGKK